MHKRFLTLLVLSLLLALGLAACGDPTATPRSVAPAAQPTATSDHSGHGGTTTTAAAGHSGHSAGTTDEMTAALKPLGGTEFEVKFMQYMIAHHQMAVDMAKMGQSRTQRAELQKLFGEVVTAQEREIKEMTGWLASWHSAKPLPATDHNAVPGMMPMMKDMEKLTPLKGADFDREFIRQMIDHHQMAVNMSALLPDKTKRAELLKLGQDIVRTQTAEIEQMKGWQAAWFK
jgi:uncharacterized protein (DUF305 family)